MSKKRASRGSSIDRQPNEGSGSFQNDDDAKRAKLTSLNVTTLQDLPCEMIECILIKAIVMEVKSMKLAKSVWKEKADLVIDGLRRVCSQWSQITTTNYFRKELHRTLDRTATETIRLEMLHQSPLQIYGNQIATMKDEIFLFCSPPYEDNFINIYDRCNTSVVKDVIPLKERNSSMYCWAACSVSNCLYILDSKLRSDHDHHYSVLRISRDDENRFTVSTLIRDVYLPFADFCVAANGSLILSRLQQTKTIIGVIAVYDANGRLQKTLRLPLDACMCLRITPKSNGNLISVQFFPDDRNKTKLMEFTLNGAIIRQYQSPVQPFASVINADSNGRILICDRNGVDRLELLDSEFNLVAFSRPQLPGNRFCHLREMCYNGESNEIVATANFPNSNALCLAVLRLT